MTRHSRHRGLRRIVASAVILLLAGAPATLAQAQSSADSRRPGDDVLAALIAEASRRFGLPPTWIRAVMQAESAFDPQATSGVGAMGLMQVMPATYAELRARHGLGPDAYAPRDNVLAGAAYLRELYDRFGPTGFLAAYNAGPRRYQEYLTSRRPLPLETRTYVARITARLSGSPVYGAPNVRRAAPFETSPNPAAAPIFVALGEEADPEVSRPRPARSDLFVVFRQSGSGRE